MISELDILARGHSLLIRQHGEDAEIVAAQRADLDRDDRDGELVWLVIGRAIAELQAAPRGTAH